VNAETRSRTAASISVRRVGPDDVKAWASMRVALLRELRSRYSGAESSELQAAIESWLPSRLESPQFAAIVAEVEDDLVGSGGISIYEVPPGKKAEAAEGYVMSMYTMPAHRGRGLALAILDGLIDFARSCGVGQVWLRTSTMGRPVYEAGRLPGLRPVHASGSDRQVTVSF
jgi:GNAT superfamily N-acetyltransferase